jgi:phytoene desaturase
MSQVIVIGAGMGGMACAARLQAQGHKVTVIEQSTTWGGKLGRVTHDGHTFDTGPSLLTLPAVYRDLFLKTGKPLEDSVDVVDLETAFRYQFSDGTVLRMPGAGVGKSAEAIGDALGGSAATQWRNFMDRASNMWAATRTPFLESELQGLRTLLALSTRMRDLRTIAPIKTLRSLSEHYFTDPRLVTLVDRYATYTGSDPRRAPAALATIPYIEQTFGAYHVAGGLRELGRALFDRCVQLGVDFQFDTDVIGINGTTRATGVTIADGRVINSDIVVANADASTIYDHLLTEQAKRKCRSEVRKISKSTPSLSGFVLLLALAGKTDNLEHHNVFFPGNYDEEFNSIFGKQPKPVDDPTIYVCRPDDMAMAPHDAESWFVLINAPRHQPASGFDWDTPGVVNAYGEHILKRLNGLGYDIASRKTWLHFSSPADLQSRTRAPGGSIYGTSSNGTSSAFLRPTNTSPLPGLFLVGGSSHPGGGLPLVAMSAAIVAKRIGQGH